MSSPVHPSSEPRPPGTPRLETDAGSERFRSIGTRGELIVIRLASGAGNYWTCFVTDPLTIGFFLFWEVVILRSDLLGLSLAAGAGFLSFSLAEYVFHRWVYHEGETPARTAHEKHHESPEALVAMPWFIVSAIMGSVWLVFSYWLRIHFVAGFTAGFLAGFVFYGILHHVHHHFDFKSRLYRKLRSHHFIHHQHPGKNFGVTTRIWDRIFGTMYRKEAKRKGPGGGTRLTVDRLP